MEIALATAGIVQGSGQCASEPGVELAHGGQLVTEGEISRTATVSWLADPPRGLGRISVGSKAFASLPFSFTYEDAKDATTPGELLAGAHSAAFAIFFARLLERDQLPPRELIVDGTYTFAGNGSRSRP